METQHLGFSRRDRAYIFLAFLTLVPFFATIFLGLGRNSVVVVALVAGIGMVAASFTLAWGTESLQFIVSQVLALAILATVQVLPEYSVDAVLAYNGALDPIQLHFATASMTGANRLLLGLGWPAVFFVSQLASRKKPSLRGYLQLEKTQALEILFLGISTLYSFFIIVKGTLDVIDAAVLIGMFVAYLYLAAHIPPLEKERVEEMEGPALAIGRMRGVRKFMVILSFIGVGTFMTFFGAQPFVSSLLQIGAALRVDQYLLIQWVAPFLTELPETVTVFYWAAKSSHGPMAIGNLVSSKLNQWTVLVGTIPLLYNLALARFQSIVLTQLQSSELLLTATQSIFGVICLLDLHLSLREALLILGLFLLQFFVPPVRIEVSAAYIALSAVELLLMRNRMVIFQEVRGIISEYVH